MSVRYFIAGASRERFLEHGAWEYNAQSTGTDPVILGPRRFMSP